KAVTDHHHGHRSSQGLWVSHPDHQLCGADRSGRGDRFGGTNRGRNSGGRHAGHPGCRGLLIVQKILHHDVAGRHLGYDILHRRNVFQLHPGTAIRPGHRAGGIYPVPVGILLQSQPGIRVDAATQTPRTSSYFCFLGPERPHLMSKTRTATIAAIGALALTGCGDTQETGGADNGTLQAVSSFTILTDIVEEVGGEPVEVDNLVPVGQDPHEYDASPDDSKALADADVFFYNGLNLEGGEHGWAARMADAVEMEADQRIETSEGVEPMYLSEGLTDSVNPHAFLDPNVGMIMAENVANGVSEADPENAEAYQENLDEYLDALTDIDAQYQQEIGDLQDDRKVLVTSERAFQYMADRYDLREGYIWSVDTDDVGTPDQIISTIDFVNQYDPPALFVESNVTPAPMETIAEDTGIDIYATVYSDELAPEGEPGDTYIGFLEENLTRISEGLQQ